MSETAAPTVSPERESAIAELLKGAVDLHIHSGPSLMPRLIDHVEAVQLVERWANTAITAHAERATASTTTVAVGPTAPVAIDARTDADATLEQPL